MWKCHLLLVLRERRQHRRRRRAGGNLRGRPVVTRGQEGGGGRRLLLLLHRGRLRGQARAHPRCRRSRWRGVEQGGRGGRGARPRRGGRRVVVAATKETMRTIVIIGEVSVARRCFKVKVILIVVLMSSTVHVTAWPNLYPSESMVKTAGELWTSRIN